MGNNASSPKADGSGSASPGGRPSLLQHHQHHSHSQHYQNNHQHQQQSQQYQQHGVSQTPATATATATATAQPPSSKPAARNPALVQQNQRVAAAPPEQSMAQAHGSTSSSSPASRSIPSRPYATAAEAVVAASSASPSRAATASATSKPTTTPTPPPSKPVNVPQPAGTGTIPIASAADVAAASAEHVEQAPATATTTTTATETETAARPIDYVAAPLSPFDDSNMDVPMLAHNSIQDVSYLTRPPRLPLPIEEEVHTPGSPIIAPADDGEDGEEPIDIGGSGDNNNNNNIEALDNDGGGLTHRSSTFSSVGGGNNNEDDDEELRVDKTRPTVPTRLEWRRGGEKVYVTGTIFQWNKKQRMLPVEGSPGVFATTINVLPGTHHIRFIVDGQMETSRDLPTTVDFGNNLVNYIEVDPQSTPPSANAGMMPPALGAPVVSPGGTSAGPAGAADSANKQQQQQQEQQQQNQQQQQQHQEKQQQQQPSQKQTKPTAPAQDPSPSPLFPPPQQELVAADSSVELTSRAPKWKDAPPPSAFSHDLPAYLVDYDQPDESPDFHSAALATEILPMPPTLPGFLGKPILNAATLIKDDNSVLNMPNYTILNHLATSSIKNNILAVSATTRYKAKFVTNIIYKPTGGDDKH